MNPSWTFHISHTLLLSVERFGCVSRLSSPLGGLVHCGPKRCFRMSCSGTNDEGWSCHNDILKCYILWNLIQDWYRSEQLLLWVCMLWKINTRKFQGSLLYQDKTEFFPFLHIFFWGLCRWLRNRWFSGNDFCLEITVPVRLKCELIYL